MAKTKYTTLQTEKGVVAYPKTSVKAVKDFETGKTQKDINENLKTDVEALKTTSNTNATELSSIKQTLEEIKKEQKYKGTYTSVSSFPSIPSDITKAEGWYAILKVSNGNDKFYIVDQTEKKWIEKGESTSIIYDGIKKVNGLEGLEGNVTIDATNINATVNGETKTIQDTLIGLKNISDEQRELIETVAAKHNVLYVTEAEIQDIDELEEGQVVVCTEDGTYTQGSIYKLNAGVWEEITSSGGTEITDTLVLSKEVVVPALNGSITYENVSTDYIFEQDEEGYWVNTNKSDRSTYALMKVNINVDANINVVLDTYCQYTGEYYGLIYISELDTEFSNDFSKPSSYKFKNLSSEMTPVVFKNVESGNHFFYVKFYRGSNSGNVTAKFKIITKIPQEEQIYTSTAEIKIGEKNNLTIADSTIATEEDLTYKPLYGTIENPVNLADLEYGRYILKGYFKYCDVSLTYFVTDYRKYTTYDETQSIKFIKFSEYFDDRFGILLENAIISRFCSTGGEEANFLDVFKSSNSDALHWCNCTISKATAAQIDVFHTRGHIDVRLDSNKMRIFGTNNGSYGLATDNKTEFVPTGDYNPATKKYVDDSVGHLKENKNAIVISDDLNDTKSEINNNFLMNSSLNELYAAPITYDIESVGFDTNTYANQIRIKEGILSTYSGYYSGFNQFAKIYKEGSNSTLAYIYITADANKFITKMNIPTSYLINAPDFDGVLYENGVWFSDVIKAEWFGVAVKKIRITPDYAASNSYLSLENFVPVRNIKRVALYEDLANAGGGSGGSKPITQFEGPEYVWEDSYTNTFGTGLGEDNRLFFYKNNGIQEVDYPLQDFLDLKMQNLRVDEAIVDKLPISGTGTESVTFNLMKNNGEEIEVVLSVDYTDGVVNSVYIYPFTKEQQYLYQDGKWNYSLIPTSSFVEEADTMIYSSDPNSILVPFLSIVDKISGQQAVRVALYDDVINSGASGGYRGDYESGTWYNRGDIVSGVGEGIFYVCLVENNGIIQPEYWNEYTEFEGVRYWQNMNYNTYISLNAMSDGAGRNIVNTYATKDNLPRVIKLG